MIGLIGKKLGQTRIYTEDGTAVHVTAVQAGPNRVLQCKTEENDGYSAVQLGFDDQKESRLSKPVIGHINKNNAAPVKRIKEFRDYSIDVKPGDVLNVDVFDEGDWIDVIGVTKGQGFQGVVRRYNFGGGRKTHGQKGFYRKPGAISGGSTPGWVIKGTKLPGHMGQRSRTVQNLKVVRILAEDNILLISGAIPGAKGDYIVIREAKKKPKAAK